MLSSTVLSSIKNYGAVGDGIHDDTKPIQYAIDYLSGEGGGTLYFPKGTYLVSNPIIKKVNVNLFGETMFTTIFQWQSNSSGAILDTSNQNLMGTSIENFTFTKSQDIKAEVTGILGGSKLNVYNSSLGSFKNLNFANLENGIKGNAEPGGVGIFDSFFENIYCSWCHRGIWLFGSGNTLVHIKIMQCTISGLVLDWLDGESFDGVHLIGGIFVRNRTDILIPNVNGIRPCNFIGTWFEQSDLGVIDIPNKGTRVMNLTFRDCMLNTSSKEHSLLNVVNARGIINVDNCTIVQHIQNGNISIDGPAEYESKLIIKNIQGYMFDGSSFNIN